MVGFWAKKVCDMLAYVVSFRYICDVVKRNYESILKSYTFCLRA